MDCKNREAANDTLLESEAFKNAIVEGFSGILILFDSEIRAQWANSTTISSYPEILGKQCNEIFCQQDQSCEACPFTRSLKSGGIESGIINVSGTEVDEEETVYDIVASPVKNKNGDSSGTILMVHNVTEKFALEKQLRHTQKMEAIGTLAGGIAHDFNNLLTPIIGYSEIIRLKLMQDASKGTEVNEHLDEILKAADRAKSLVQQVLTFSRTAEKKAVLQYLHPIAKEVMKLLRISLPRTLVIEEDIDEGCGMVLIDPVQMHQVLINLCSNASQAIGDEHGKITVTLKEAPPAKDGTPRVELSVNDTGVGIEPELLARIFEPYFTTREKTRGTGMGLALVHGIISGQGGHIKVESEPGKGSTFRLFFPVAKKSSLGEVVVEMGELQGGTGKVLLVDDEPQVVKVTGDILRSLGYCTAGETAAGRAFELFSQDPDNWDLIMTGLAMPDMTGLELCKRVKAIRPDIPVVLFTSHSARVSKGITDKAGIDEYCMKPISMRSLATVVATALGKEQKAAETG